MASDLATTPAGVEASLQPTGGIASLNHRLMALTLRRVKIVHGVARRGEGCSMPGTYSQLLLHVVFSTKRRTPWIATEVAERLYPYIGGIIRAQTPVATVRRSVGATRSRIFPTHSPAMANLPEAHSRSVGVTRPWY